MGSPFHGLSPIVIRDNALSSANILTERSHDAPTLFNSEPRLKGEVLLQFEFAAYRSDFDMTVTRSHVNPNLLQLKAVHDLEVAQKKRIPLQQVVSSALPQYRTDDASHKMLTKATEFCEVYSATIDESLVRIQQVEKAFLPLATKVEQMSETSGAGAPPDALGVLGFQEIFGDEGSGSGAASASCAGPASTAGSTAQWPSYAEPL